MSNIVDLTNLRSMTDGDAELEHALFEEFKSSCEASINTLIGATGDESAETWRSVAHAMKGISSNLGAQRLTELCRHAQEIFNQSPSEKHKVLEEIKSEYAQVKAFLEGMHSEGN